MDSLPDTVSRRLAAILAVDATNYSGLVARNEESTLRALAGHRATIDRTIGAHGGRIFSTAGDSVLAEFSSPVQAVRAAIEMQRVLTDQSEQVDLPAPMLFRVGVNVGDVVVDGDNLLGDGVNVAVRLENLAPPGGICVSGNVHDHIAGKLDCRFQYLGTQFLKNIPRPVRAYQITAADEGSESVLLRIRRSPRRIAIGAVAGVGLIAAAIWFAQTAPNVDHPEAPDKTALVPSPSRDEVAFWETIKHSANPDELRVYLKRYPRGTFVELARTRLDGMLASESRYAEEKEAATRVAEAERARQEASHLKIEADAAIERAATEQHTAARLRAEAEQATARAAAAADAALKAQKKLAHAQGASSPLPSERVALVRTVSPLDGRWSADFSCEASPEQPATSMRFPAQIVYREIRIENGQVGLPGYFRAYGSVLLDGSFQLVGTSLPRTQRIVGVEDAIKASGRTIESDRLEANATIGKRNCALALTRIAGQ